jgi:hypothetical protein
MEFKEKFMAVFTLVYSRTFNKKCEGGLCMKLRRFHAEILKNELYSFFGISALIFTLFLSFTALALSEDEKERLLNAGVSGSINAVLLPESADSTGGGGSGGGGSGGGGGGGYYMPAVSTPQTALSALSGDTNKDNKVDIFDFNILMINWGNTNSGNSADFNNDKKVDIFDFNLMMVNWTK